MVTDCPFTVAVAVLIIGAELVGVDPPLLPVLLPQATTARAIKSMLVLRNTRFNDNMCDILLLYENRTDIQYEYIREKVTMALLISVFRCKFSASPGAWLYGC